MIKFSDGEIGVRFWWFHAENNYGDVLTPHILKHFGIDARWHHRDNRTRERWGDQGFLQSVLGDCQRWQDVAGGIYSYKAHCSRGVPADARVICFHGKPRPWDVERAKQEG
jgi:hypothetical protein